MPSFVSFMFLLFFNMLLYYLLFVVASNPLRRKIISLVKVFPKAELNPTYDLQNKGNPLEACRIATLACSAYSQLLLQVLISFGPRSIPMYFIFNDGSNESFHLNFKFYKFNRWN